jgi:hypothetical protein
MRVATEPAIIAARRKAVEEAMWAGDRDTLDEIAGCTCCCYDHTWGHGCPAYQWGGCRGQGSVEEAEQIKAYAEWYAKLYGMSRDTFFNDRDGS